MLSQAEPEKQTGINVHKNLEKNLPFLIEEFSSSGTPIDIRWETILQRFFSDCELNMYTSTLKQCDITNENKILAVPSVSSRHGYILSSKEPGYQFTQDDLELASSLHKLTKQFMSIEEAFDKGASEERRRIARDLHDDVAARMLTLIHTVKDDEAIALARSILKSLRSAIYTLDNKSTARILDAVTDVRSEIQDRLNSIGMQLLWHQAEDLDGYFTPRQHINLNRMLHEVTTNIIRHANANFMEVIVNTNNQLLTVECSDDGTGFDLESCIPGKGINNITTRARELGGTASFFNLSDKDTGKNKGSCVRVAFPISESAEEL